MGEEGNKEVTATEERWTFIRGKWGKLVYELLPGNPVTNLISHIDFMDRSCICSKQDKMHNWAVKRWAHPSFGRLQHSESSPAMRASHQSKALPLQQTVAWGPRSRFCNPREEKNPAKLCILAKRAVLFAIQRQQIWHAVVLHYGLIAPVQHNRASLLFPFPLSCTCPLLFALKEKQDYVSTASVTTSGSYVKCIEWSGVFSNRTFHFQPILQRGQETRGDLEVCASQTGWTQTMASP